MDAIANVGGLTPSDYAWRYEAPKQGQRLSLARDSLFDASLTNLELRGHLIY